MTLLFKKVYLILLLTGLIIFVPALFVFSLRHGLNGAIGMLTGIFPLFSWDLLGNLFRPTEKVSPTGKLLYGLLGILKISIVGVGLYFISRSDFFLVLPFIIGMTITLPIIIIAVLSLKKF